MSFDLGALLKETVLACFFRGEVSAADLARDIAGSEQRVDSIRRNVYIEDMEAEFIVTREMALSLCDAVLRQELDPDALRLINFALTTSEKFIWADDDLLAGDIR